MKKRKREKKGEGGRRTFPVGGSERGERGINMAEKFSHLVNTFDSFFSFKLEDGGED